MATVLLEVLSQIAPETAKIIQRLQDAKLNEKQIMLSLLAFNLENCRKTECMIEEVRATRSDIGNLSTALKAKGVI